MEAKGSCLARVPYTSLLGFILIFVGGGVLCGTLYHGIFKVDAFFRRNFFPVYSFQYLRIAAVVSGAVVILLAIIVVVFSALVTNATRQRVYRGDRFVMGGRFSATLFMGITYVAIVFWLVLLILLVVPTFCWIMFNSICTTELADVWHGPGARRPGPDSRVAPTLEELRQRNQLEDTYTSRLAYFYMDRGFSPYPMGFRRYDQNDPFGRFDIYIFNLTHYGVYIKPWLYDKDLNYREAITTLDGLAEFCDEVSVVGPVFACSLGGAVFVLFGLTLFVGSLSGFYTRLKLTKELTDFKQSIALRSPKAHDHSAYF
ncbi:hypothetical protein AHF37_03532 [Paragonimus kellicotti]|nr:hypothetical protein AHF37_03532 [Paragonimus kellicotti]